VSGLRSATPTGREPWRGDADKYLLPDEPPVIARRRHWASLARPALRGVPAFAVGVFLLQLDPANGLTTGVGALVALGALGYLALHVAEWWRRFLLITRRRVLLTSGVIIRTVAIMPLRRITDLTWQETAWGQVLGYGTFRFESAGQRQGLDEITFVPGAKALYKTLSQLMFGSDYSTSRVGQDDDDGTGAVDDGGNGSGATATAAPATAARAVHLRAPARHRADQPGRRLIR